MRSRRTAGWLAVAVALVAAACSGGDDEQDATESSGSSVETSGGATTTTLPGASGGPTTTAGSPGDVGGSTSTSTGATESTDSAGSTTTVLGPTTTLPDGPKYPLTGLPMTDELKGHRVAIVVKIDNHPQARPQSGLNRADIVFEENVENLTRFAAVFQRDDADPVGPVRSGRTQDIDLLG